MSDNAADGRYEPPAVRRVTPEELLTEAQQAVDAVFDTHRRVDARLDDLNTQLATMTEDLEKLEAQLTEAERKVQKASVVADLVKEAHEHPDQPE
jgi:septal ring factor EnvC (AmiA/AmiB activator)